MKSREQMIEDASSNYIEKETEEFWIDGVLIVDDSPPEMIEAHKKSFKAGARFADENPSEKVMKLVEALRSIESGSVYVGAGGGKTPKTRARLALDEWNRDETNKGEIK